MGYLDKGLKRVPKKRNSWKLNMRSQGLGMNFDRIKAEVRF